MKRRALAAVLTATFTTAAPAHADGEVIAAANAVWIELNDPQFLAKLREENE